MKLKIKDEDSLLLTFSNELAGYQPEGNMNVKEFDYPITFEVDKKAKTFKLLNTTKVTEVPSSNTKPKCKCCPYLIIGIIVIVALILILV